MSRITRSLIPVAAVATAVAGVVVAATRSPGPAAADTAAAAGPSANVAMAANPYVSIGDEPPPKLIVDPPDPAALARGVVWIQYRVENLRVLPVFNKAATAVSPRVGHLHVHVDDVPWWWAHTDDINTVDIAGMPPGEHKVRLVLVDPNHAPFPGQSVTVTFTVPESARRPSHAH